jgi:hypothetical protein
MADALRRAYFALLIPAILGFIVISGFKALGLIPIGQVGFMELLAPLLLVLSVAFALGLPVFFRALFAHRVRKEKSVSEADLLRFERTFLYIALVTPYLTLIGYLLEFPRFHLAGSVLMSLYAVYYYFPSQRRIRFEKRIFRVK